MYIIEDEPSAAHIQATLGEQEDICLLTPARNLSSAIPYVNECDILLLGSNLPEDGAFRFTRTVTALQECIQVIIFHENASRKPTLRYLEAGAIGFVLWTDRPEVLVQTVRSAARGEAVLPPNITAQVIARLAELSTFMEESSLNSIAGNSLTRREQEILYLIGRDFSNQDIANHLIIEVGTVKNHVHNILTKLGVNNRRQAASYLSEMRERRVNGRIQYESPQRYIS